MDQTQVGDEALLSMYDVDAFYDEVFESDGAMRPGASLLKQIIDLHATGELRGKQQAVEQLMLKAGITFTVYNDNQGTERIFPFDMIPRPISAAEWDTLERGLKQRITALNMFIGDVYNEGRIFNEKIVPEEMVRHCTGYRKQCEGLQPPHGIWAHITGTDLVRNGDGQYYVLEDNLRCPSGVSYVLQNRRIMQRAFPDLFAAAGIRLVVDYPSHLLETLKHLVPDYVREPKVGLLTPGVYNSAYFEHSFLAQQMGIELVEGRDLVVRDKRLYMRTTRGFEQVHVLYRRIDDDFLDPKAFRPDSMLGVPGLIEAYRAGNVALANAPGTGVADDKAIYTFVPDMIRFYLSEEAILPNVPTYLCRDPKQLSYVLEHLSELVTKPVAESGGYGMLVGPAATKEQISAFADRLRANPDNYISQPTLSLSRMPTLCGEHIEGRHVDLRPFILMGAKPYVLPGGLTRVAMRKGSLVVNSSQGGGSKDTWVFSE
ncbi:MAG: circularly permuted type 2 ATP-grasp protein [Planctomycetes bacterium]|nr:circularly permuted type 2 ATP-grasp protein [Planctomycetota bacterium]